VKKYLQGKKLDLAQIGKAVVDAATKREKKNPAAVELGRLGGLKGGKARARKLSASRRSQIAKDAAEKRWKSS
jgi:hypothetical protein